MPGTQNLDLSQSSVMSEFAAYLTGLAASQLDPALVSATIDISQSVTGNHNELRIVAEKTGGIGTGDLAIDVYMQTASGPLASKWVKVATITGIKSLVEQKLTGLFAAKYRLAYTVPADTTWSIYEAHNNWKI